MIQTLLTTIAAAGLSMSVMAQNDSTTIKRDTVKSKETGSLIFHGTLLTFGPQTDSSKAKPKTVDTVKTGTKYTSAYVIYGPQTDSVKAKPKAADTVKTGSKYAYSYVVYSPQTDSSKAKPKAVDTVKTGTKYAGVLDVHTILAFNPIDGPQTDSLKTKPGTVVKPDSTTKPGADKKTGAMYFDRKTGSII
ncbi:hypothetical protein [Cytophaga hutchinsonii]|nr:hypothetical protein [Cytophaga hutchinsonii]